MMDPVASRPTMPGYGILAADEGAGLLPWAWAVERLERAHNYWVATCRPDGAPHLAAVWGVWLDRTFTFSTGGGSRKARNLGFEARCVITPEDAEEAVVVEGVASRVVDPTRLAEIEAAYVRKYGSGYPDPEVNPLFAVSATTVFGVIEREAEFSASATRWKLRIGG